MAGLRALTLLALAAMLVEPVLISSQRETIKSHLAIILDDSESMKFSDPYTDQSRAAEIASQDEARVHGRAIVGRAAAGNAAADLVKNALEGEHGGLGEGPRGLPVRPRIGGPAGLGRIGPQAHARRHPAQPADLTAGRCAPRRAGRPSRPASGGPGDRDRRPAPTPAKSRCERSRRPSGRTSRSSRSPPGRPKGRATCGWRRSRSARSSSFATR